MTRTNFDLPQGDSMALASAPRPTQEHFTMSESTGPLFNSPRLPWLHTRVWRLIRWAPHRWHHLCAYRSCAPNLYSSAIVATADRRAGATGGLNAPTSSTPRAAPARLRAAHPAGHRHGGVGPFTGVPVGAAQVPARSSACRVDLPTGPTPNAARGRAPAQGMHAVTADT